MLPCSGSNGRNEFCAAADSKDRVIKLASGGDHTVLLTAAGKVLTWGCGAQGQLGRLGERVSERTKATAYLTPT
ncbi:hypothetical protein CYMTET_21770, partial [Cymbomonas tetramitiformis]